MDFTKSLRKAKVDEATIARVSGIDYPKDPEDPHQDSANYFAAAMAKCEELLDFGKIAEVMFHRACCKSGFRLANAKKLASEHDEKPLEERLLLLGDLKYMGKPALTADGDIVTVAVGSYANEHMSCPCWNFKGRTPVGQSMPLTYCLCCAGHFQFHYQKALGLKLKVKQIKSSILNSQGKEPCVFLYEILR